MGWNTPIAQVPDLLTEGNSGEAEALQHSFLSAPPPSIIFNLIWLGFSNWFSSSYYFNWGQENFSGIFSHFLSKSVPREGNAEPKHHRHNTASRPRLTSSPARVLHHRTWIGQGRRWLPVQTCWVSASRFPSVG